MSDEVPLPLAAGHYRQEQSGVISPPSVRDGNSAPSGDSAGRLRDKPASGREVSRPLAYLLRTAIFFYRHTFSCFLGRNCRFLPTCSAYADEAIRLHGSAKGTALAFRRVCRCHPWGQSGFDPVPLPPAR